MGEQIQGGYYLKARCIKHSEFAHAPPHVRDIFDYLLREAFWQDGQHLKRGQLSSSYDQIREDLHWFVGWRKERYSESKCASAMKYLKKHGMIVTRRTSSGFIITICKYDTYQTPSNYEGPHEELSKAVGDQQPPDATVEEGYNTNQKKEEGSPLHQFYLEFRLVHKECERVTEPDFIAAVASCRTMDVGGKVINPDVAGALVDFRLNCACMSTFRPQSPIQKFRNYLNHISRTEEKNRQSNFQKKTRGGVNRFGLTDADLLC